MTPKLVSCDGLNMCGGGLGGRWLFFFCASSRPLPFRPKEALLLSRSRAVAARRVDRERSKARWRTVGNRLLFAEVSSLGQDAGNDDDPAPVLRRNMMRAVVAAAVGAAVGRESRGIGFDGISVGGEMKAAAAGVGEAACGPATRSVTTALVFMMLSTDDCREQ